MEDICRWLTMSLRSNACTQIEFVRFMCLHNNEFSVCSWTLEKFLVPWSMKGVMWENLVAIPWRLLGPCNQLQSLNSVSRIVPLILIDCSYFLSRVLSHGESRNLRLWNFGCDFNTILCLHVLSVYCNAKISIKIYVNIKVIILRA